MLSTISLNGRGGRQDYCHCVPLQAAPSLLLVIQVTGCDWSLRRLTYPRRLVSPQANSTIWSVWQTPAIRMPTGDWPSTVVRLLPTNRTLPNDHGGCPDLHWPP